MKRTLIFKGKRILRIGFFGDGRSNGALFSYLTKNYDGITYTLRTDAIRPALSFGKFTEVFSGEAARKRIDEDLLFLSPSVRRDAAEFREAEERGVILSSDVEFFFENKKIPVFAVTGSDGKSTTATLASLMLSEKEGDFPASANIGIPMSPLLSSERIRGTVAELSSFQLMSFAPTTERALITNVTENHLDWHLSMQEYLSAKENALKFTKKRIFNLDCPYSLSFSEKYPAFAVFSTRIPYSEMQRRISANHYFSIEDGYISSSGRRIIHKTDVRIRGEHNLSNLLGAIALCAELASDEKIIRVSKNFAGLDHRARLIGRYENISFYDSSIDSTPSRTAATLKAFDSPIVLILGGRSKKLSYEPLFPLPKNVRSVILMGENRDEILSAINGHKKCEEGARTICARDFSDAVMLAIAEASSGDSVLLSPASTSFDAFANYAERGNAFSDIIKKYYAEK